MFAILLKLTPAFIFALPGVIALVLFPGRRRDGLRDDPERPPADGHPRLRALGPGRPIISALIAVMNSISTMTVRDFVLHFRPGMTRAGASPPGADRDPCGRRPGHRRGLCGYKQPEGIYKYLNTISASILVMPIAPAIVFGIMSKRVTFAGAAASVLVGLAVGRNYMADAR